MSRGTISTIRNIAEYIANSKGFEQCLKNVTVVSAGDGKCRVEFPVEKGILNGAGALHGGFIATLVSFVSTYALMTTGSGAPGVSVDTNISYLSAALLGEVVIVDAKTCRTGRTLAFLEVELLKKENGVLLARGQQTKFIK